MFSMMKQFFMEHVSHQEYHAIVGLSFMEFKWKGNSVWDTGIVTQG